MTGYPEDNAVNVFAELINGLQPGISFWKIPRDLEYRWTCVGQCGWGLRQKNRRMHHPGL
ncbi:hypothetical protein [Desertivirga xinjiangensis]|uniref:hypothetical protein n=1 Tax=Desertivirga xinjiangensis TaxID=539206 RepID=UPI00210B9C82|nr:hypothetical protein [Pedobacter xinjiangensis]